MRSTHILAAIGGIFGAAMGALSGCWSAYDDHYVTHLDAGPGCSDGGDCDDKNPCTKDTCKNGECLNEADDSLNPADDGNPCTKDTCEGGEAKHPPVQKDTLCAAGSLLKCDGTGKCAPCVNNDECGTTGEACTFLSCDEGACGKHNRDQGYADGIMQTQYDCKKSQCNGTGKIESVADMADVTPYAQDCVDHACDGEMSTKQPSAVGTMCAMAGGAPGFCNMMQDCKVCAAPAYGCEAGSICVEKNSNPHCAPCENMISDPGEADTDCGGPDCKPCGNGKHCLTAADCENGNCVDGYCCDFTCAANCNSCGLPGHEGTCFAAPAGYVDTNTDAPCLVSQVCSADGLCVGKASTGCGNNAQCLSGKCMGGSCAKSPKDGPCSATSDCGPAEICVNYSCKSSPP
jgi:hypothetical protein